MSEAYWRSLLSVSLASTDYLLSHRALQMLSAILAGAPQRASAPPYCFCTAPSVRSAWTQTVQHFLDVPSFVALLASRWPFGPDRFSFVELFALHTSLPLVLAILLDAHADFAPLLRHCAADPQRNALWDTALQTFLLRWDSLHSQTVGSLIRTWDTSLRGNPFVFEIVKRLVERDTAGNLLLAIRALPFCSQTQKQVDFWNSMESRSYVTCWIAKRPANSPF